MINRSVIAGFLAVLAGAAQADDWPQFRGPGARGVSSETGLPTEWGKESGLRWKVELPGRGLSSPVVIGERAYLKTTGYYLLPKRIDPVGSAGHVHLSFKIKNIGRTRAKIIECKADGAMAATIPETFPDPFEGKSAGYSDGIIVWPGKPIPVGFDVFTLNVDIDWRDIQLHKLFVSVWGGVRYSDVFGDEHVTKFALVFHSDALGDTPGTDRLFPPPGSGKFNDAT